MFKKTFLPILMLLALAGALCTAHAQDVGVIKLLNVRGSVTVDGAAVSGKSVDVSVGQEIETTNGSAILFFSNGSSMSISKNSKLTVTQFNQASHNVTDLSDLAAEPSTSNTQVSLSYGEIIGDVKKLNTAAGSSFNIDTPVGIAGIRGTTFLIQLLLNAMTQNVDFFFACEKGEVSFTPAGQALANAIGILSGNKIEVKIVNGNVEIGGVETLDRGVANRINRAVQSLNDAIDATYGGGGRARPVAPADPRPTDPDPSPDDGVNSGEDDYKGGRDYPREDS